jgi:hypothetical protein
MLTHPKAIAKENSDSGGTVSNFIAVYLLETPQGGDN